MHIRYEQLVITCYFLDRSTGPIDHKFLGKTTGTLGFKSYLKTGTECGIQVPKKDLLNPSDLHYICKHCDKQVTVLTFWKSVGISSSLQITQFICR